MNVVLSRWDRTNQFTCVFWPKLKRKHLPDYLKLEKHISLGSQIWIVSFSLQAYEQNASFEYPRGKKRERKLQISEPLQNPRKIQKPEFKMGSHDRALSSIDLIMYFEQCCIAMLGLVRGLSTASNNSRAAEGGHSCTWPQHLAFIWSSPPAESLEESPAQKKSYVWPAGLGETDLLGSHSALMPSSAIRPPVGPKKTSQTELLHVGGPRTASWVQSIQCHLPFKLPSLRALKRMSWNQELLHFAQQHNLDKKWSFGTSLP